MVENQLETNKKTITPDTKKIDELEKWFRFEYPARINNINRYLYLGLKLPETRYALEIEAYNKENELRILKGLEPLAEIKIKNIL